MDTKRCRSDLAGWRVLRRENKKNSPNDKESWTIGYYEKDTNYPIQIIGSDEIYKEEEFEIEKSIPIKLKKVKGGM